MHYLSHFLLAKNYHEKFLIGNFIGITSRRALQNRVLKRNYSKINTSNIQGLVMHDLIDHFSENHPIVIECKNSLTINDKFKAYSLDLFFDHFLAANWNIYCDITLSDFIVSCQTSLKRDHYNYTDKSKRVLKTIVKNNLLGNYSTLNGMHRIIHALGKISGNIVVTESAIHDLMNNYSYLQDQFHKFFPLLIEYLETKKDILCDINEINKNWIAIDQETNMKYLNLSTIDLDINYKEVLV